MPQFTPPTIQELSTDAILRLGQLNKTIKALKTFHAQDTDRAELTNATLETIYKFEKLRDKQMQIKDQLFEQMLLNPELIEADIPTESPRIECKYCNRLLPQTVIYFERDKGFKSGFSSRCKRCSSEVDALKYKRKQAKKQCTK